MSARITRLLVTGLILLLASCGGGDNGSTSSNEGRLSIGITDAPVDGAEAVVLHVTSATLHGPGGDTTFDILNPADGTPGRDIDLLLLQGGQWTGLFDEAVTAGHYSWIRLEVDLDPAKSYIQIAGQHHGLRCTSCENVGYRINRSFDVAADATQSLMLDFDVRKSITAPHGVNPEYVLRPTVRLLESAASGAISGTVDPTLLSTLTGGTACSVYVYAGSDATPDDVYIPLNAAVPGTQNNPVTTAKIATDGSNSYTAAFLPAGDYTLAVTCDAVNDSAANDDTLTFSDTLNAKVMAGGTTTADFPAPAGP